MNTLTNYIKVVLAVVALVALLAVSASISNWYAERVKIPVSQTDYIKMPKPKIITKIKLVEVPGPEHIVTIDKPVVVEKLHLPDWVKTDENKQVIAVAKIPPYEGKTNAAAILDIKTGEGEIIAKQVPLSFMSFENKKELGLRSGYTTDGFKPITTVYGRYDFLRVGNIHLGLYGEANSNGEGIGQIELNYKF